MRYGCFALSAVAAVGLLLKPGWVHQSDDCWRFCITTRGAIDNGYAVATLPWLAWAAMATIAISATLLLSDPSAHLVAATRQLLTHRWWNHERHNYQLVISQYVVDEASSGDPALARDRLIALDGIPLLPPDPEVPRIAREIMATGVLPPKAQVDALHIASVAHHRVQYLLTWNCKHIANAKNLPRIHAVLAELKLPIPIICTPEELLGDDAESE